MLNKLFFCSLITQIVSLETTTTGCACKETWTTTLGITVNNYCGNPDNDSGGNWCATECSNCGTDGWGYCASAPIRESSTAVCTSPYSEITSCVPSSCSILTTGTVSPVLFGCCCSGLHQGSYCQECAAGNCEIV